VTACSSNTTQTTCQSESGCYWTAGATSCNGAPTDCSALATDACTSQPGCSVQ